MPGSICHPCDKYLGSLIFIGASSGVALLIFLYFSYKFIRLYGITYKCMVMFFLTLNLSIIFRIVQVFHQFNISKKECSYLPPHVCRGGVITYLPLLLMISSFMFSYYNWVYQIRSINDYFSLINPIKKRLTDASLVIVQSIIVGILVWVIVTSCALKDDIKDVFGIFVYVVSVIYAIVATVYIIIGKYYYSKLKYFSPLQAKSMKKRILLSVLFIALPLYLRAIENIVRKLVLDRNNFSFINGSIKNNDFGYPAFSIACYFICELLPICTMMIGTKVVINHYYQNKNDHYGATSDNKLSFNLLSDDREISSIKESSRIENTALSNSKGPESTVGFMKYVDELSGNELTPSFRDSFDNSS